MSYIVASDALDWTRSLMQARLIAEIFSERVKGFVLKGGMAMKVHHSQARATQDIDLDCMNDMELYDMQLLMRKAILRATKDKLLENIQISEPKQTDTTARWRIKGFDPQTRQPLTLTVEVSRRDHIHPNEFEEVPFSYSNIEKPILVYNNRSLAFKKIKALLSPSREAPRDVADLFLLIKAEVDPPVDQLKQFIAQNPSFSIDQWVRSMWDKIDSMDTKRFKSEVLPSLPATHQAQEWYKNWDDVRLEVASKLEQWLRQAHEDLTQQTSCTPAPLSLQGLKDKHDKHDKHDPLASSPKGPSKASSECGEVGCVQRRA